MAGDTEAAVRADLGKVREMFDKTGPSVVEALCVQVIRLAREIDELRAEHESKR
jgi:hypothetical protein